MATLHQIAEAAEVSPATVSLALRNKGRISDDTRQRVMDCARRLRYRRPGSRGQQVQQPASSIGSDRAYHIGLIAGRGDPNAGALDLFGQWLLTARQLLLERGHVPMVCAGGGDLQRDALFDQLIGSAEFDAALVMGVYEGSGYVTKLMRTGRPLMLLNRRPTHDEFSYVTVDNLGGGRLAAERLIALGHRKLAVVRGDEVSFDTDRAYGFEQAVGAADVQAPLRLQYHEQTGEAGYETIADALAASDATAAFCTNDHLAQCIGNALLERGVEIPEDFSLIGFDNTGYTLANDRKISSIDFDRDRVAALAVDLLLDVLDNDQDVIRRSATVAVRYVDHETTPGLAGPPHAGSEPVHINVPREIENCPA